MQSTYDADRFRVNVMGTGLSDLLRDVDGRSFCVVPVILALGRGTDNFGEFSSDLICGVVLISLALESMVRLIAVGVLERVI